LTGEVRPPRTAHLDTLGPEALGFAALEPVGVHMRVFEAAFFVAVRPLHQPFFRGGPFDRGARIEPTRRPVGVAEAVRDLDARLRMSLPHDRCASRL
jgi:hypothetical protein